MDKDSGEIVSQPASFSNDKEGFDFLLQKIKSYPKDSVIIVWKILDIIILLC